MQNKPTNPIEKFFKAFLSLITWFAIILQLYLTNGSFFNFISYFTILSNILVALSLTSSLFFPNTTLGKYFSLVKVQSAIALYIFIVGLVYNLVLRGIWSPTGWQLVVDNLLHVAVPVVYVVYWLIYIPKGLLNWVDGLVWAYFPLAYLIYSLIRGHVVGWYPYPFLDVNKIGYQKVLINSGFMVIAFFVVGLFMIAFNKLTKKNKSTI
ncbi:hypothetical protein EZ428_20460 [Pedobacter frigiditerrae]|uniref:FAR-17a/AIG1-like protein n=1 Tax=Pedobacter frigiditerrae TaxID=2530452 RepID=A0A4V2MHW6_9SPHI|nr:Pr6Pr family membrane protein [Pedobacter frigiditerrae]TCC88096.1 hypothetical protein EZ428_20460 [Pedobacter frigiditerrae]